MPKVYKSYWNTPKKVLLELCVKREMCFEEEPTQREIVLALFDWDKENGTLSEVIEEDEDGKVLSDIDKKREELITVIFHNKDEQDTPYVYIGLNGKSYYIPKDQECTIPKVLMGVIDDAIETRIYSKKNRDGKMVHEEKRINRFPYTIVNK